MAHPKNDFADYCCELLSAGIGPCTARRMFGGFGISASGLNVALVADLGSGEKLWLKADATTRQQFEAAGCERFSYMITRKGERATHSLNYYSAPEEAMESPEPMAPWARLALNAALKARKPGAKSQPKAAKKTPQPGPGR